MEADADLMARFELIDCLTILSKDALRSAADLVLISERLGKKASSV